MKVKSLLARGVLTVCAGTLLLQATSCGTLFYPERKGQKDGRIDATVAILDALGLLFGIIPGVIAFALDFSNGTIYLPPGEDNASAGNVSVDNMVAIQVGRENMNRETIEAVISQHLGRPFTLDDEYLKFYKLDTDDSVQEASIKPLLQH